MDIVIHSLGMSFDGNTVKQRSLGGSETAAYYQARELAKLGHRVHVFSNCNQMTESEGVRYVPCGEVNEHYPLGKDFDLYAVHTPIDVLIIQRHPFAFHKKYNSKVNIWQLHDLALFRTAGAVQGMLQNITAVTVVSQWHKDQVCKVYGLNPERVHVIRNGVDPDLYEGDANLAFYKLPDGTKLSDAVPKDKFVMLYQSRPERGLDHLVRPGGIMERLKDTRAHLVYCAYDNTTAQMKPYYDHLHNQARHLPNVTCLGSLTKQQLAALQKNVDLLCYPTEFEEVSCITAMEAMHAGLPMLTSDVGALKETCEGSGTYAMPLKDGKADEDAFVDTIKEILDDANPIKILELSRPKQLAAAKKYTCPLVATDLDNLLTTLYAEGRTVANQLRDSIDHSDIDAADMLLLQPSTLDDAITAKARAEVALLYDFRTSHDKYVKHYDRHQSDYYGNVYDENVGDDPTNSTRFKGTLQVIGSFLSQQPGKKYRVLDYGCAHGAYLVPIAKLFPQCEFVGMDISPRAINAAQKWIEKNGVTNATVIQGDHESFADAEFMAKLGMFDAIFAGEVLEHVPDDIELLNKLAAIIKPKGVLCITTPSGRWEWSGTVSFRTSREHIHHYTRKDIEEICSDHAGVDMLFAPAGPDQNAHDALGWWVWGIHLRDGGEFIAKTVVPAYPRQTVSACLIVKDGEKTIRKCVESFIDAVDEIVIAIDPLTTDRTRPIIESLREDYPRKPFVLINGIKATEDGFDEARNKTIDAACGDWILWCDADEEVQNPWNLWQYLRPSMINAVGLPQVHYSMDPPRVLTTDYPCRLFRRGSARFYGVVHEHPETSPGEGIPFSTMRGDVMFLHNGYINESVRRQRFMRNLPLLARDREKYPNRKLNKFLMVRDIAQGIQFELEQTGGRLLEDHPTRAQRGIDIWREMLKVDPVKMCVDALQFYSVCVQASGGGFESKFAFSCATPVAPDRAVKIEVQGVFKNADDLSALHSKLLKEATSTYDERYL